MNSRSVTDLGEFYRAKGAKAERTNIIAWLRQVAVGTREEKQGGDAAPLPPGFSEDHILESNAIALEIVATQLEAM